MFVIGLTGGIGAGKSTVAKILQELGAQIIDADEIGHECYLPQTSGWHEIIVEFGEEIKKEDQTIDRKKLGAVVFGDPVRLKKLNEILWPKMRFKLIDSLRKLEAQRTNVAVLEAAVLIEAGWDPFVHEIWAAYAPRKVVMARMKAKINLTEGEIKARMTAQPSPVELAEKAAVVINTHCPKSALAAKVKKVFEARVNCLTRAGDLGQSQLLDSDGHFSDQV